MSEIFNYTGFKEPMDSSELLRQIRNQELNDLKANPTFLAQIGGLNFLGDSLGKLSDYFLAGTEDDINVNDVQKDIYGSTWGDIFTQGERRNSILSNINSNVIDYADVKNNSNLGTLWDSNEYQAGVNTLDTGEQIGAVSSGALSGAAKWAATAASINPALAPYAAIAGGLVDGTKSLMNVLQGNKTAKIANNAIDRANSTQFNNYVNQARSNRNAMYRSFAEGGPLESENGVEFFNVGGTHESNPYGGIFQGTAEDGSPNLVEEGEVLYNDYVFSKRLKANGGLLKRHILPEDYAGMTFADIAKKVQEDSEQRPYDPVSKNYLDDVMAKLQAAQEEVRAKKASKEAEAFAEFSNMFAGGGPFGKNAKKRFKQPQTPYDLGYGFSNPIPTGVDDYIWDYYTTNALRNWYGLEGLENYNYRQNEEGAIDEFFSKRQHVRKSPVVEALKKLKDNAKTNQIQKGFSRIDYAALKSSGYTDEQIADLYKGSNTSKKASNNSNNNIGSSSTINIDSTGTKSYTVTKDGKSYTVRANSPEEAKRTVRIYLSNNSNNDSAGSGSSYESTRTSVRVKEKGRAPGNKRSNASITTAPRTPVTTEPLIPTDNNTPKGSSVTPATNTVSIPDLEPEYDETNTTTNPSPRYRRSPLATAAMLAPAIGNIGQAFTDTLGITNRPDYYVEQGIRRNASNLNPIAPKLNTDYQEYRHYDVNVMNNQLLAQEYAAQRAARENLNPHTQAAQLLALNNAFGNVGYMANLQAQQANDAKRNATLQWNHGINKENAATVAAYDEINQGIKQQRLNMLNQALQAKDASDTARAQVVSANRAAALTDLGSVGRYINDTGLTNALINSGVFGPLNSDMSDIYKNLQILNLSR